LHDAAHRFYNISSIIHNYPPQINAVAFPNPVDVLVSAIDPVDVWTDYTAKSADHACKLP